MRPLVSVLLCTHNSRELLPIALESYLSQDYENRELVVVDDGDDSIDDLVGDHATVYLWHPAHNLSEKRNAGIRAAHGDYIVHFDSDDWSAPNRITRQMDQLKAENKKVIGYSQAFWYDTREKHASYARCGPWGASLLYERQWALGHPWDEDKISCEDGWFLAAAYHEGQVSDMEGLADFVALAHRGNRPRPFKQTGWPIVPNETLPEGFRTAMARFE